MYFASPTPSFLVISKKITHKATNLRATLSDAQSLAPKTTNFFDGFTTKSSGSRKVTKTLSVGAPARKNSFAQLAPDGAKRRKQLCQHWPRKIHLRVSLPLFLCKRGFRKWSGYFLRSARRGVFLSLRSLRTLHACSCRRDTPEASELLTVSPASLNLPCAALAQDSSYGLPVMQQKKLASKLWASARDANGG